MRERYSNQLAAVTGILIVLAVAAFALLQSPELQALSLGKAAARAQAIPHALAGRNQCDRCHGPQEIRPYPVRHLGWHNTSCTRCHAAGDEPPQLGTASRAAALPHPLREHEACETCHDAEGVLPYPADHRGFPDNGCTECHPAPQP